MKEIKSNQRKEKEMAKKKALGDDPLFVNPESTEEKQESEILSQEGTELVEKDPEDLSDIVSTEKLEAVKKVISEMKHEVKKLEQRKKYREDDYQRMTFIIRKDLLDKLRDYCYTERIPQKEGLERALLEFLQDKDDLVSHPERPKQVHKRS